MLCSNEEEIVVMTEALKMMSISEKKTEQEDDFALHVDQDDRSA